MRSLWTAGFLTLALFAAGSATATPISMDPGSVSINSVIGNDFTLTFDGGDTSNNVLNFTIDGGGGCGFLCGSTAVAAMVFDGVDVIGAGDTEDGVFNSDNVIFGVLTPGGDLTALLVDFGAPNSESFWAQLSGTPTTATVYALDLDDLGDIRDHEDILESVLDAKPVRFTIKGGPAVPEPSAAMIFAAGLLVVRATRRRR